MSDIEDAFKRWEKTIQDGIDEWKKTILESFAAMNDEAERRHVEAMALARGLHAEAIATVPPTQLSQHFQVGERVEIHFDFGDYGRGEDWYAATVISQGVDAKGEAWAKVEVHGVHTHYGSLIKKIWLAHDRDPPWRKSP